MHFKPKIPYPISACFFCYIPLKKAFSHPDLEKGKRNCLQPDMVKPVVYHCWKNQGIRERMEERFDGAKGAPSWHCSVTERNPSLDF